MRRLLLSGATENDKVSGYAPRHQFYLEEGQVGDLSILENIIRDMALTRGNFIPIVNDSGIVRRVYSIKDLPELSDRPMTIRLEDQQRVLVIGGAGYLGSVLVRRLLAAGYAVRVLDSFIYGAKSLNSISEELQIVRGDIRDIHVMVSALDEVDSIILLAAVVGDPASKARPVQTIETNLLATQAIATASRSQHISRFIYASTCSVYGTGSDVLDEKAPLNPVSLYARTKIDSEKVILAMADSYFAPTILRMGTLYGFSPRMRFDLVVNTMTKTAFTDQRINVFGGNQWRPLLQVEDAARAFMLCLEADIKDVGCQVFNVGSDEQNYRIDDIADLISKALGNVPLWRDSANLDARDYRVSFDKIRKHLSFVSKRKVEESSQVMFSKLKDGTIRNPLAKVYYNHYFDFLEE